MVASRALNFETSSRLALEGFLLRPRTIEHTGILDDLAELPLFLRAGVVGESRYACSFCGVSGRVQFTIDIQRFEPAPPRVRGVLKVESSTVVCEYAVEIFKDRWLDMGLHG